MKRRLDTSPNTWKHIRNYHTNILISLESQKCMLNFLPGSIFGHIMYCGGRVRHYSEDPETHDKLSCSKTLGRVSVNTAAGTWWKRFMWIKSGSKPLSKIAIPKQNSPSMARALCKAYLWIKYTAYLPSFPLMHLTTSMCWLPRAVGTIGTQATILASSFAELPSIAKMCVVAWHLKTCHTCVGTALQACDLPNAKDL